MVMVMMVCCTAHMSTNFPQWRQAMTLQLSIAVEVVQSFESASIVEANWTGSGQSNNWLYPVTLAAAHASAQVCRSEAQRGECAASFEAPHTASCAID
jgi:hypothetical protein